LVINPSIKAFQRIRIIFKVKSPNIINQSLLWQGLAKFK
jgi:hypothetical protein